MHLDTDITSIEAMLLKIQLRCTGHVSRMEDPLLPKFILCGKLSSGLQKRGAPKKRYKDNLIILCGKLSSGLQKRGAPKKRYKDNLKKSLRTCNISHLEWTTLAEDRGAWRRTISKAASSFKSSWRSAIDEK